MEIKCVNARGAGLIYYFGVSYPNRKLSNSSGFKVRGDVKADNTAKSGVMGENVREQTGRQSSSMQVRRVPGVLGGAAKTETFRDLHFRPFI